MLVEQIHKALAFITHALSEEVRPYVAAFSTTLDSTRYALATFATEADLQSFRRSVESVVDLRPAGILLYSVPQELCCVNVELLAESLGD